MKLHYELSKLALKDIDNIWEYTLDTWSKAQANKYYKKIFSAIGTICDNPEIGKSIEDLKSGHRIAKVKFHLIVYKKKNSNIYIDRILHQRMDVESHI